MKTRIITFHNGNLNPDVLKYQKLVFNKFEIPLEQIKTELPHPDAVDNFIRSEEWDIIVLFDADCIPLYPGIVEYAINQVKYNHKIFGASQKASHIPNSKVYVSPCFMAFTNNVWEQIGKPSFKATDRGDVAEEMSYGCREKAIALEMLWPSHVENPVWDLIPGVKFGHGTTYGKAIYHAFESNANHGSTQRFIEKCKEVLSL